ncbi:helix-turn-helix domain-containing protein [Nocardia higoensis]|uniref:helix-turn-helix domain-containing protein n=1 Tax=Nocardia higoensis TaxID=228599 RepID=UPI0002F753E9|nr:helix-turn-helix transcriptional regulator [Nocardia higoensis]
MRLYDGEHLRAARVAAGISLRFMAARVHFTPSYLSLVETGKRPVTPRLVLGYEDVLGPDALRRDAADDDPSVEAWIERINATDIPDGVLGYLDYSIDDLAIAYPATAPSAVLEWALTSMRVARAMLDRRKTLGEHRRLMLTLGWFSLLAAACHVDLGHHLAARQRVRIARDISLEAEHSELTAWSMQTMAWQQLTDGDFTVAATASQVAQHVAPRDSTAFIQATAQEGRALARMGNRDGAYTALRALARLVSGIGDLEGVEHHFRFDPAKSDAYMATILAWLGDPAAESFARQVISDLQEAEKPRPRRLATARLDLGLALLAAGRADEAAETTLAAVASGQLVPSAFWRLDEVVDGIERVDSTRALRIRETFRELYPPQGPAR